MKILYLLKSFSWISHRFLGFRRQCEKLKLFPRKLAFIRGLPFFMRGIGWEDFSENRKILYPPPTKKISKIFHTPHPPKFSKIFGTPRPLHQNFLTRKTTTFSKPSSIISRSKTLGALEKILEHSVYWHHKRTISAEYLQNTLAMVNEKFIIFRCKITPITMDFGRILKEYLHHGWR